MTDTTTALATLVEPLKRELAVPGEFDTIFPNTGDPDLTGSLADAFGQAQLDGFFGTSTVDLTALTVTPALSSGAGALLVLYAAERTIRAQLRNLKTAVKYEAGGVIYDVQQSASVLTQELKDIQARRTNMLALILRQSRAGMAVHVGDAYLVRARGYFPLGYYGEFGSFYGYEVSGYGFSLDTAFGGW